MTPLSLHLNVQRGFEPLTVKARISLTPTDINRHICVGYINADTGMESQDCRSLRGLDEPATLWYEWKNLHAGWYTVYALVARSEGKDLSVTTTLDILSTQ